MTKDDEALETVARRMNVAILAKGEDMPERPSYWMIWLLDEETKKPSYSRGCWDKVMTPREASNKAFGMGPSPNMRFFNLGTTIVGARKRNKELYELWRKVGGT